MLAVDATSASLTAGSKETRTPRQDFPERGVATSTTAESLLERTRARGTTSLSPFSAESIGKRTCDQEGPDPGFICHPATTSTGPGTDAGPFYGETKGMSTAKARSRRKQVPSLRGRHHSYR